MLDGLRIAHLHAVPRHLTAAAELIHAEFWTDVPGASPEGMARRLALASSPEAIPLSLVALLDDELVGVVNLVDNDDDDHPDWHPWLAGMVVAGAWRGRGVGSALVRALLADARRLGIDRVYFGTDGPGFYTRLGAVEHAAPRPGFWFMRFELGAKAGPQA
jgi:predicted N-acetyltransferase YhbS